MARSERSKLTDINGGDYVLRNVLHSESVSHNFFLENRAGKHSQTKNCETHSHEAYFQLISRVV